MRVVVTAPVLILALATASGCGDSADDTPGVASAGAGDRSSAQPSNTPDGDGSDQGRKFAQCMREHGVPNFPDPNPDGSFDRTDLDSDAMQAALPSCREMLPNGGQPSELDPALQEKLRQFARCMRDNGVNMPDPDPNSDDPGLGAMPVNPNDPNVRKIVEACQEKVNLPVGPGGGG